MDSTSQRNGRIEYLKEGFILHWDEDSLSVEVIDYDATVLRLAWKDVLSLAAIASGTSRPKPQKTRPKRNPPREV
jgi:hypothetical protein